jgi:hypothetical protein
VRFYWTDRVRRDETSDRSCCVNDKGASVITTLCCGSKHGIMSHIMGLLIVLLLALPFAASSAATLTGRTVRVTDGDTIVILSEGNVQHKIRLQGIDAPERRQAYGTKSKEHLSEWVAGRFVVVETDKLIGTVALSGRSWWVEKTFAWRNSSWASPGITRSTRTNKPHQSDNSMPMRNRKRVTRNVVIGKI